MKNLLLFCFVNLFGLQAYSQSFYDLDVIQNIEINFSQNNWDALLDAEKAGDQNYILAESITINGETFDSIGVKYKGNSTYNANQIKNPFHIELDTYKNHDYQGYTDIKLSNIGKDPSCLREVLSYQILGQYMDAPKSNYANIYVNGNLIGLYSNSESISKRFVNDRFGSKSNTFIKCNPPAGAGPQSNDFPNLVYLGQDSISYYDSYELKSETGWQELIDLCDTLSNFTESIEDILDIDRVLWMLAYNNVLVNLDSYSGRFAQNYYLYKDDNQRFIPIVWDLNESFGRFSDAGTGGPLFNTNAKQSLDILLHENDNNFPLIQRILSIDIYKKKYLAHCKTIVLENFDNEYYYEQGLILQEVIDEAVQQDQNKFFSYQNFQDNLVSDVNSGGGGPGGGTTPGIVSLMSGRSDYLLSTPELSTTEPSIISYELSTASPFINETLTIRAYISNANFVELGYRTNKRNIFNKIELFDDGNHNDELSGDGIYGADIFITNQSTQFYIYSQNDDQGMFSPRRAEFEYHTIQAQSNSTAINDLVINEFMASNDATIADQDGEFDDWIELYNNGTSIIDLTNFSLSDNPENISKWIFPSGSFINPNDYLLIWADNDEEQEGLHTSFKLSSSEESISIWDTDQNLIDQILYTEQITDTSFGRFPNGTGDFRKMSIPTPKSENDETTGLSTLDSDNFVINIFPNPAQNYISIESENGQQDYLRIYDTNGSLILKQLFHGQLKVEVDSWSSGLYFMKFKNQVQKFYVK